MNTRLLLFLTAFIILNILFSHKAFGGSLAAGSIAGAHTINGQIIEFPNTCEGQTAHIDYHVGVAVKMKEEKIPLLRRRITRINTLADKLARNGENVTAIRQDMQILQEKTQKLSNNLDTVATQLGELKKTVCEAAKSNEALRQFVKTIQSARRTRVAIFNNVADISEFMRIVVEPELTSLKLKSLNT